jgi:hypothetical protein
MKLVLGFVLLFSFSVFAQDAEALKKSEALKQQILEQHQARIAKIKAEAGKNELSPQQKFEISEIENMISILKKWEPTSMSGVAGGYAQGTSYAGGAMTGGMAGGFAGGYAGGAVGGYVGGGMNGGYPINNLWNCQLSHDEKEITCANGKKYKLSADSDESDRSEVYKQQWIPNVLEIEKKKAKQE